MIPETFRKSAEHRRLFATMLFLSEHDPLGPITKSGDQRELRKSAIDRHRTILEHRASDGFRDYFRHEREHVVSALADGRSFKAALRSTESDLAETYRDEFRRSAIEWRRWAIKRSPRVMKDKTPEEALDAWLKRNAGKRITGISETTRKKLAAEIARGQEQGESVSDIADRIDKFYLEDIIPNRSMVIARTEVGSAVNWMQNLIAENSVADGIPMEKEWIALNDARTREDHSDADGQRVGVNDPFEVGGDLLMYPGDPSGSPEEIINCRCSMLHHVVDEAPRHKTASPYEFAKQVSGLENADVITALAFMKGVYGPEDEWDVARNAIMKRVYHIRRAVPEDSLVKED